LPSKPKVWAIVVGIDRYEDASIPRCEGAVRDARAVAEWFTGQAGWSETQILRMDDLSRKTHGAPSETLLNLLPTKSNLDWALVEWLGHRVRKDDVVVLYFAGQATARPPRSSTSQAQCHALPIDARVANLDETGWPERSRPARLGLFSGSTPLLWAEGGRVFRSKKARPMARAGFDL
jgi:uncharacterized caspase-like protein